jgi:hypothetical protein
LREMSEQRFLPLSFLSDLRRLSNHPKRSSTPLRPLKVRGRRK